MKNFALCLVALSMLAVLPACSKAIKTEGVTGVITYNGEPLADATVKFIPTDATGSPSYGTKRANTNFKRSSAPPTRARRRANTKLRSTALRASRPEERFKKTAWTLKKWTSSTFFRKNSATRKPPASPRRSIPATTRSTST